ncbi:MAG: PEP-CTERM sorting domain-containing protein [Phycisphaerales bacterium JB063]
MKPAHLTMALALLAGCPAVGLTISDGSAHVDVLPYNDNGQVALGHYDFDLNQVVTGTQLFVRDLEVVQSSFFGTTSPGFTTAAGYTLLPSASLDIHAQTMSIPGGTFNLLYWDGIDQDGDGDYADDVAFGAPAAGDELFVRRSSALNFALAGESTAPAGFALDLTSVNGTLHKHISFQARNGDGTPAQDGLYLASFTLTMDGLDDSDPFYMLFNAAYLRDEGGAIVTAGDRPVTNDDARLAAIDWIDQTFFNTDLLAGDLNGDGFVGAADLDVLLANWGDSVSAGSLIDGDPSGDGVVGQADLQIVRDAWGNGAPPPAVPEPTALALIGLGGLALMRRRH